MDFFINKNSTLPVLKMSLVDRGSGHDSSKFYDKLQNSNVYFTMSDIETGVKKIGKSPAGCEVKQNTACCDEEYLITYQFSQKQTSKPGTYIGQFIIEFLDGSGDLIVPIQEELHVHVIEGSIKK